MFGSWVEAVAAEKAFERLCSWTESLCREQCKERGCKFEPNHKATALHVALVPPVLATGPPLDAENCRPRLQNTIQGFCCSYSSCLSSFWLAPSIAAVLSLLLLRRRLPLNSGGHTSTRNAFRLQPMLSSDIRCLSRRLCCQSYLGSHDHGNSNATASCCCSHSPCRKPARYKCARLVFKCLTGSAQHHSPSYLHLQALMAQIDTLNGPVLRTIPSVASGEGATALVSAKSTPFDELLLAEPTAEGKIEVSTACTIMQPAC